MIFLARFIARSRVDDEIQKVAGPASVVTVTIQSPVLLSDLSISPSNRAFSNNGKCLILFLCTYLALTLNEALDKHSRQVGFIVGSCEVARPYPCC